MNGSPPVAHRVIHQITDHGRPRPKPSVGEARWVLGAPRRGDGGFNAPWTWHIDPASVSFAEVTIEACQTTASAVEEDLEYWIGFGQVCIWGVVEAG
jgi:hypothetical protein